MKFLDAEFVKGFIRMANDGKVVKTDKVKLK